MRTSGRDPFVLLPAPAAVRRTGGMLRLDAIDEIVVTGQPAGLLSAAERIAAAAAEAGRPGLRTRAAAPGGTQPRAVVLEAAGAGADESYRLDVSRTGIRITASAVRGAWYGAMTLCQVLRQARGGLPCCRIEDAPDFPARGVMLDISRDKVPTLETVCALVDMLAGWKISRLELYTEHTFAYREHRAVWAKASPFTGEEVLRLDRYCRERFVELVPNQNSFGHMERWLKHAPYSELAESPQGFIPPWGGARRSPSTLNPLDPRSLRLVAGLYDELLPHFSSRNFNVGLDETWELGEGHAKAACARRGKGRVYLDFLLKIHREVKRRGRTMHFWGDIIVKHPELIPALPGDAVALDWGYEANHPFEKECAAFRASGLNFFVCPGTSSWCSILGRTDNAIGNLRAAAEAGLRYGAVGYLNTDWGDGGHWQYLPVSYLGLAFGAAQAWSARASRELNIGAALDRHCFRDDGGRMGRIVHDLGNAYRRTGHTVTNGTMPWHLLRGDAPWHHTCGMTPTRLRAAAEEVRGLAAQLGAARLQVPDGTLVKDEFRNGARLFVHACERGAVRLEGGATPRAAAKFAAELRTIVDEHRRLWLARNRPGGLVDSVRSMGRLAARGVV